MMTDKRKKELEQELEKVRQQWGFYANIDEQRPLDWRQREKWHELGVRRDQLEAELATA